MFEPMSAKNQKKIDQSNRKIQPGWVPGTKKSSSQAKHSEMPVASDGTPAPCLDTTRNTPGQQCERQGFTLHPQFRACSTRCTSTHAQCTLHGSDTPTAPASQLHMQCNTIRIESLRIRIFGNGLKEFSTISDSFTIPCINQVITGLCHQCQYSEVFKRFPKGFPDEIFLVNLWVLGARSAQCLTAKLCISHLCLRLARSMALSPNCLKRQKVRTLWSRTADKNLIWHLLLNTILTCQATFATIQK